MITPFDFQNKAVDRITAQFLAYLDKRPGRVIGTKVTYVPYYQALASITASGKTVIMAQAAAELLPLLSANPIVVWLSKGRVVVDQTLANLSGKYRHLLADYQDVQLLADYSRSDVEDESLALVYLATVGTFNQRSKDKSSLRLFRSDIDNADRSTWDALKARTTASGVRRPLFIVYDEAHNLTDQQTNLLMELEPDGMLLATATPKLPAAMARVTDDLKRDLGWVDADLTTYVKSAAVVEEGLVKRQVLLGGYQATMQETLDDGLSLTPKAIYICRTNIVEGNALKQDDPKRPFAQREAPPILIWNYLVHEKGIDPATVAVYTSALKFDKDHPPPADFVHFKGGDDDYANFTAGGFRHVIFNLGLQEGWDDPECYFAYIDKSMQSNVQVEQIIGRVLRQPGAEHFEAEVLNTAHFYVRVDAQSIFADVVKEVGKRIAGELPEVQFTAYDPKRKNRPIPRSPSQALEVPHVYRDPSAALDPIDEIIRNLIDFRGDTSDNVRGGGAKALVQQRVGSDDEAEVEWVEREHGNAVSARWVFQTAVRRQFPLALEVTRSDESKFDAKIELRSPADELIRKAASEVVTTYLEHVVLKQRQHNPYVVGEVLVDPTISETFTTALHGAYSGLNKTLELPFAQELDLAGVPWCRNPPRSGFGIPLLAPGASKVFYPDFLAWKGKHGFALDTKGEHILESDLGRKLLAIDGNSKVKVKLLVRLISRGNWDDHPQRTSGDGFTVWALGHANALKPIHCPSFAAAVKTCLKTTL